MEIRINELRERLQRKKQLNAQLASQLSENSQLKKPKDPSSNNRPNTNKTIQSQQVAAVEPFNRRQPEELSGSTDDVTDFTATKGDPKYQTLPYNTRFTPTSFLNNNNNNKQQHRGSPSLMMMKGLKVASVQPQQPAQQQGSPLGVDRPALPPKPQGPVITAYKPLLPPRQTLDAAGSKESSAEQSSVSLELVFGQSIIGVLRPNLDSFLTFCHSRL